jgi:hypothetical protein
MFITEVNEILIQSEDWTKFKTLVRRANTDRTYEEYDEWEGEECIHSGGICCRPECNCTGSW